MNSKGIGLEYCDDPTCPCNQWIPPTDEERVMFANATYEYGRGAQNEALFEWYRDDCPHFGFIDIAESLALDGMDIDDVSKIEELMR